VLHRTFVQYRNGTFHYKKGNSWSLETCSRDVWVTVALRSSGCVLWDTYMCVGDRRLSLDQGQPGGVCFQSRPNLHGTSLSTSSYARTHSPVQRKTKKKIFLPLLCPYRSRGPTLSLLLKAARDGARLSSLHQPVPLFFCEKSACAEVRNDIWVQTEQVSAPVTLQCLCWAIGHSDWRLSCLFSVAPGKLLAATSIRSFQQSYQLILYIVFMCSGNTELWENGVPALLNLKLGTTRSASSLGRLNPRENSLVSRWVSEAVWAILREKCFPIRESNHDSFTVQSVVLSLCRVLCPRSHVCT